jgi:hypothetical protein
MKKIIALSVNIIIVLFILSSCSHKISLTKKHYSKGYYVESNKIKNNEIKRVNQKNVSNKSDELKTLEVESLLVSENNAKDTIKNEIFVDKKLVVDNKKTINKNHPNKIKLRKHSVLNGIFQASKSESAFIDMKNKNVSDVTDDDDKDGLSLFWIVILILLLLWFFGFILLSNILVHLILLLALILLLLWLLRII